MRLLQRPPQIQNTKVNHGLMMIAKMPSQIAKMAERHFGKILHRIIPAISASSERKLEERRNFVSKLTCHTR